MAQWFFDLLTNDEDSIVEGKPLTINTDLLFSVLDDRKPGGLLFAYNLNDGKSEATRNILGTDVILVYSTAEA